MEKKRKVLFVHDGPIYKGKDGNYFDFNKNLIERYGLLGSEVIYCGRVKELVSGGFSKLLKLDSPNFKVIEIPNVNSLSGLIRNGRKAINLIKTQILQADLVVLRFPSVLASFAHPVVLKNKKPFLVEVVACVFDALYNYGWKGKLMAWVRFLQYKKMIKKSPHVMYVTNKFLQKRYPNFKNNIGMSDVVIDKISEDVKIKRLDRINKKDSLNPGLILATVASIDVPYKRQIDVLKAIKILKEKGSNIKYFLVGAGEGKLLKKFVVDYGLSDHVVFKGIMTHHEVQVFYESVDVYIQPSKVEGLPRAVVEAMSKGCYVLGSTTGGIPELVREKDIFRIGDFRQIAKMIEGIQVGDLKEGSDYSFNVASNYNFQQLHDKRIQFYKDFLSLNQLD